MIRYLRIQRNDPLYTQEIALRSAVLLEPIGYDFEKFLAHIGGPEVEDRYEHFVAALDTPGGCKVVGCALLLPDHPEPGTGKLMQMAVDPQRRGEGIGRRLVIEFETRAFAELGYDRIFCHAQCAAVPFYEHLGWRVEGDEFQEAGIPHRMMIAEARRPAQAPEPVPDW